MLLCFGHRKKSKSKSPAASAPSTPPAKSSSPFRKFTWSSRKKKEPPTTPRLTQSQTSDAIYSRESLPCDQDSGFLNRSQSDYSVNSHNLQRRSSRLAPSKPPVILTNVTSMQNSVYPNGSANNTLKRNGPTYASPAYGAVGRPIGSEGGTLQRRRPPPDVIQQPLTRPSSLHFDQNDYQYSSDRTYSTPAFVNSVPRRRAESFRMSLVEKKKAIRERNLALANPSAPVSNTPSLVYQAQPLNHSSPSVYCNLLDQQDSSSPQERLSADKPPRPQSWLLGLDSTSPAGVSRSSVPSPSRPPLPHRPQRSLPSSGRPPRPNSTTPSQLPTPTSDKSPLHLGPRRASERQGNRRWDADVPDVMQIGRRDVTGGSDERLGGETEGSELNVDELRQIASRQQDQISRQKNLLRDREAKLVRLQEQEEKQKRLLLQNDQLRAMKDTLEMQEKKLRKLRSTKSQVEYAKKNNENVYTELNVVKRVFEEKQKELEACTRRVTELTRQLNQMRLRRQTPTPTLSSARQSVGSEDNSHPPSLPQRPHSAMAMTIRASPTLVRSGLDNFEQHAREADHLEKRIDQLQALLNQRKQLEPGNMRIKPVSPSRLTTNTTPIRALNTHVLRDSTDSTRPPSGPVPANGEPVGVFLQRQNVEPKSAQLGRDGRPSSLNINSNRTVATVTRGGENGRSVLQIGADRSSLNPASNTSAKTNGTLSMECFSSSTSPSSESSSPSSPPSTQPSRIPPREPETTSTESGPMLHHHRPLIAIAAANSPPLTRKHSGVAGLSHLANKTPPRYASRSTINNTYTKKMGNDTLERYKRAANEIYANQLSKVIGGPNTMDSASSSSPLQPPPATTGQHATVRTTFNYSPFKPTSPETPITLELPDDTTNQSDTPTPSPAISPNKPIVPASPPSPFQDSKESKISHHTFSLSLEDQNEPIAEPIAEPDSSEKEADRLIETPLTITVSPAKDLALRSCLKKKKALSLPKDILLGIDKNHDVIKKRSVTFHPLAILLDSSLEGDFKQVKYAAGLLDNISACTDEGITALHNAVCAQHVDIVEFLVNTGADVNACDTDGWTPVHCAASCGLLRLTRILVEAGGALYAKTYSDNETPLDKCESELNQDVQVEEYIIDKQNQLGVVNNGRVFALYPYTPEHPDELALSVNQELTIIDRSPPNENDWWLAKTVPVNGQETVEGLIAINYLSAYPKILPNSTPKP